MCQSKLSLTKQMPKLAGKCLVTGCYHKHCCKNSLVISAYIRTYVYVYSQHMLYVNMYVHAYTIYHGKLGPKLYSVWSPALVFSFVCYRYVL